MKLSPLTSAMIYLGLGAVFVYFAYQTIDETIFNPLTIILIIIASLEFGVGIRFIQLHFKIKRNKK
ncbi:YdiK family protein [Amphibacillus sp. Q70]|uniref:YdiK family protein n=1 Tax=Amphibacillus sp. Q70 TaxID=3453416 RepID=UPI003F86768C